MSHYQGQAVVTMQSGERVDVSVELDVEEQARVAAPPLLSWRGEAQVSRDAWVAAIYGRATIHLPDGRESEVFITDVRLVEDHAVATVMGAGEPPFGERGRQS